MKTSSIVVMGLACIFARAAHAGLTLTPAGQAQGFGLSVFASNFSTSGAIGPLGIDFPAGGGVLVSDQLGNVRRFAADIDGQNAALAPIGHNYGNGNSEGLAHLGSNIYMDQSPNAQIVQINGDGTFNQSIISVTTPVGLVADPVIGRLFVATRGNNQVFEVDPIARTKTLFASVANPDGLSVSPDGKTLYVAATGTGHILGYDIATGTLDFDSGAIAGGIDGTAAGAGSLSNFVFANVNNGTVVQVNLSTLTRTVIANGGSRGDFVSVDPTNDTLLITQTDSIYRLTPPSDGGFTPEPTGLSLLACGGAALVARRRRLGNQTGRS
ncbi:MAG: hypothetical protein JWN24_4311 [Phycisphaerales bacterium]|nr:hypothetical protein [Phycisphaerales bacterium]